MYIKYTNLQCISKTGELLTTYWIETRNSFSHKNYIIGMGSDLVFQFAMNMLNMLAELIHFY